FINDRSYCPRCKKTLSWYELMPIMSYFIQFGKCRYCGERISPVYPIIEALTGCLFLFSYMQIGFDWELVIALMLVSMLMIILVSDIHYMIIQNNVLRFFLPFFIIMRFISPLDPWWSPIVGSL